jgi:predicted nucleotidyltransferase
VTPNQSITPTPYPDVNALLGVLLKRVRDILREKLVGFYLYGSLSCGDFDPDSSDVDFLIVTTDELDGDVLDALRDMHANIAASGLPYARKLEGSYLPREALRRYDPHNAMHPSIGIDWEFGVGQHGTNWILERYIVREQGIIVLGPSPKTLIDPVRSDELGTAVCGMLRDFWQAQLTGPDWLRPRDYQAFAILSLCRARSRSARARSLQNRKRLFGRSTPLIPGGDR